MSDEARDEALLRAEIAWLERKARDWKIARALKADLVTAKNSPAWAQGPRTLLSAAGIHHRETVLVASLGWLLQPAGHHMLGRTFLDRIFGAWNLPVPVGDVEVALEEVRANTRADLILRSTNQTLLLEAKVWAKMQKLQLERLASRWQNEPNLKLVFLTPDGSPAETTRLGDNWIAASWSSVALHLSATLDAQKQTTTTPHLGVLDLSQTLEEFYL